MAAEFFYRNPNAPTPNKPIHVGVCVIVQTNNRILFELRSDSRRWALIGGGVEVAETLHEAAARELAEETGIFAKAEDLDMAGMFSDPSRIIAYPDGNVFRVITYLFRFEASLDQIAQMRISSESKELRLVARDDVFSMDIVETHRHILHSYFDNATGEFILE